jgi:hypothetical protein
LEEDGDGIDRVRVNPYKKAGKALVSKVAGTHNLKDDILRSVDLIGGFNRAIEKR